MSVTLIVIVAFLAASLYFYAVLGGADFGAGILEFVTPRDKRAAVARVAGKVMGPVWEANHMWVVLAVVILFNGFPRAYALMSTALHIPLTLMLIGIVLRGTSFTFRHYDAYRGATSQAWYQRVFAWSSFITPLMFGMIAAALMEGLPGESAVGSYADVYVTPWANGLGLAVGVFVAALAAFTAAAFLTGETHDRELQGMWRRQARGALIVAFLAGAFVLLDGEGKAQAFRAAFWGSSWSWAGLAGATGFLVALWHGMGRYARGTLRVLVGGLWLMIFAAWFLSMFPVVIHGQGDAPALTFAAAAAPESTLRALLGALLVGSAIIFPFLGYLFRVFAFARPKAP